MNNEEYIIKMKIFQELFLNFIEDENETEDNYGLLSNFLDYQKIILNRDDVKSLLYSILKISQNHYRTINFYSKIEQFLKENIKTFFASWEIFNIFKSDKRILLFLFEENIINVDQYIYRKLVNEKFKKANYDQFFSLEIEFFQTKKLKSNKDIEKFKEKRKIGQNDSYICELIRNDSIDEFIIYLNQTNISPNSVIKSSIYETNSFLLKNKNTTLIEYAAFFGSIQIFQYLYMNDTELTSSIWLYAIHSKNAELFYLLEEKKVEMPIEKCIIESIKCHHNDFVDYFINNHKIKINDYIKYLLKYYNFQYIQNDFNEKEFFYDFIKYDYPVFYKPLISNENINELITIITNLMFKNTI